MKKEIILETDAYNRRQFMRVAALTAAGGTMLAGCNQAAPHAAVQTIPTVSGAAVTATAQAELGKTYFPSPASGVPDAYTVPLPPFQSVSSPPGQGGTVTVFSITYLPPPVPKDQNRYWLQLEARLNATWNITQAVGKPNYIDKVGTLLASGSLPDLFLVNTSFAPSLYQAIEQGAFSDLTPHLSGSALNDYPNLARFPAQIWQNATINGKLYGVPRPFGFTNGVLLYRKDWATKVGIPHPQNSDDFYKLLQAFTKGDPDGNKQADTWGMSIDSGSIAQHQFFMNLFRVPNKWRQEANGSLTYFIQTQEYRQAVAYMAKIYAAGFFYPNSLTQSGLQNKQSFTAGKFGAYLDGFSALYDQRTQIKAINPKADVGVMVPFGANGGHGNYWLASGFSGFTSIPSSVSNPDRVKELLRILNYLAAPAFSEESVFLSLGVAGWDHTVGPNGVRTLTPTGSHEIELGSLVNVATPSPVYYYPAEPSLGPIAQQYTRGLLSIAVPDPTANLVTPTATKQGSTLDALINDRVLRIVRGIDPLTALDTLINDWKAQGGTQIAQEFAQAIHHR